MRNRGAYVTVATFLAATLLPSTATCQRPDDSTAQIVRSVERKFSATPALHTSATIEKSSALRQTPNFYYAIQEKVDKVTIGTDLVNLEVSVTDSKGRFVPGLSKEQFEIFDDKVKQEIAHFSDEDVPISIGIIFDVSGSMKEHAARAQKALKRFIETLQGDDDFFLITFNDHATLAQDFTTSPDEILLRLSRIMPTGETALYDAAYLGVRKAEKGRHSKRAILIISDREDNSSRRTFKKLYQEIEEADVQIYAIGINDYEGNYGRPLLIDLTQLSGGRAFFPKAENEAELLETCTRIALELRHQYSIGFYPTDTRSDTARHKIQVRLNAPKGSGRLSVYYRQWWTPFKK